MTYQHSSNNYARVALKSECLELAAATSGRNDQLVRSSFSIGQLVGAGLLPRHEVEEQLLAAATANGYVGKDGISAAKATIKSGLEAGMKEPRPAPSGSPVGPATPATLRGDAAQTVAELASVAEPKSIRRSVVARDDPAHLDIPEWTEPGPDGEPNG